MIHISRQLVFVFSDCKNGEVRLVGGSTSREGTVEVCFDNLWGLIADGGWDEKDASVICSLAGHSPDSELGSVLIAYLLSSIRHRCYCLSWFSLWKTKQDCAN